MPGSLLFVVVALVDFPPALREAAERRHSLPPMVVDWYVSEDANLPGHIFHYGASYAKNGDLLLDAQGDQEGWVWFDGRGPVHRFPHRYLQNSDGVFAHARTTITIETWKRGVGDPPPQEVGIRDVRWIGLSPFPAQMPQAGHLYTWPIEFPDPVTWASAKTDCTWSEERHDSQVHVRAEFPGGAKIVWTLESDKDLYPSRIVAEGRGQVFECAITLAKTQGHWFPQDVSYSLDGQPFQSHWIADVSFPASASETYGLRDLGAEPGFNVSEHTPGTEIRMWDGERDVSLAEWDKLLESGKRKPGPAVIERARNLHRDNPYWTDEQRAEFRRKHDESFEPQAKAPSEPLGPWRKYTLDFIVRFQLDSDQRQKAMQILKECEELGQKHLDKVASELADVQRELSSVADSKSRDAASRSQEKLSRLLKPLDEIFETRLVPKLDTLPTRAQRAKAPPAASKPAASRPVP